MRRKPPPGCLQRIRVASVAFDGRHRQDMGDLAALAQSIGEVGLLQPIVVTNNRRLVPPGMEYRLVAGERRLRAVVSLDWQTVPAYLVDCTDGLADLLRAERAENTCRKEFTVSEAVAIGKALEEMERAKAEKRKKAGTNQHSEPSGKLPEASAGRTRDKVAEAVGMSGRTYEKAKAVVEAAEADPATYGKYKEEMDRTGKVDRAYRLTSKMESLQDGTYHDNCKAAEARKARKIEAEVQGVGVIRANEAINCLMRIPQNDALRSRAFEIVRDWMNHAEGKPKGK